MNFSDYFWLNRAGRYARPKNTNDRLPIVYGDLTDGSEGIWQLPCIDTTGYIYCFAAHAVLTVANGNSISIYSDGTLVDPANYTFSASNNVESLGTIATITFTADQGNKPVTARGKGKNSGTSLITNIIDIVNDFLTVHNTWTSTVYDSTSKAMASATFTAQSYAAAGVIDEDIPVWDCIQKMMASFYGTCYLNAEKKLAFLIDTGNISQYADAGIIRTGDLRFVSAIQKKANLINQCPASYAYNYVLGADEFFSHTDLSTHADAKSQNVYGRQEPANPYRFYWCRDLTSVQKIQDIIVKKFKNPVWEIEVDDLSLKNCHVDIYDRVAVSCDWLYDDTGTQLANEYWQVISIRPDFSRGKVSFRALDTGYFMDYSVPECNWEADTAWETGTVWWGRGRDLTPY